MNRSWGCVCLLTLAAAATGVQGQGLRAQCNAQVATEVLRDIYAAEVRSYPLLAQVFADANSAPVKAAVNDCQAGREGGGRAGMDRWIRQAQNRQWYWQNLVTPAYAQAQAQDLRAQCNARVATDVLREIYAAEVRSYPLLAQVFADANSAPVRAAVNDCQAGREGGGRAGMDRWIRQAQNRQWYWQNLVTPALSRLLASQERGRGQMVGSAGGDYVQAPTFPGRPPGSGATPPRLGVPPDAVRVPLPSTPPRMGNVAAAVQHHAQAAMDLAQAPALRQIPDADEAMEFLGMAGALAELLANPHVLASVGGSREPGDDPLSSERRLAIAQAAAETFAARFEQGSLRRLSEASMASAWHFQHDAVVPVGSWRERSVALITDDRISIPEIRETRSRVDWSRFDKAETLFLMIELSRALKNAQQGVRAVGDIADFIDDMVHRVQGLDTMPIPALQAALKTIAVTAIVSEITSEVIEGSTALMPGRIDEFYVRVNGTDRRPRDPALTIEVGTRINLEVFLTYSTNGGSLATPWYLLELAVPRLMRHPKVSQAIAAARSRAGAAAANLEREIEARIKGNGYAVLKAELEKLSRKNQSKLRAQGRKIYAYIQAASPEFPIASVKRSTEINSDRVLRMQSNSPNLLEVGQTGSNQFFLMGKTDSKGQEAGYHVALKAPLLQRMVMLDDRTRASPNLLGTVIVKGQGKPPVQQRPCNIGSFEGVLDAQGRCVPFS